MDINKDRLWKLLDDVAEGKYRKLARMLDVQVSHLHKLLNKQSKAGPAFLGKLYNFCKDNGLDFDEFVVGDSRREGGDAHATADRCAAAD